MERETKMPVFFFNIACEKIYDRRLLVEKKREKFELMLKNGRKECFMSSSSTCSNDGELHVN